MTKLTLQCGGWPRTYVVWVQSEAGQSPPARDWRSGSAKEAIQKALGSLGITEARVVQAPDTDNQDDSAIDLDWGIVFLQQE